MSTVTPETSMCVERENNKITSSHQFCVKPPNEMIKNHESHKFGVKNTAEHIGATFRYLGAIVVDKNKICSEDCGYYPCKGNAYVTSSCALCTNTENRLEKVKMHTFKDYTTTTNVISGRENDESEGQLGSVLSDLTNIISDNDVLTAVTDDPTPLCKKVRLKCSVLHIGPNDTTKYYGMHINGIPGNPHRDTAADTPAALAQKSKLENTGEVYIAYRDLIGPKGLYARGYVINNEGVVQSQPPEMEQELKDYYKEGIQSGNIPPAPGITNAEGFNNKINNMNEKFYYFLLSIFLAYILYKMIYVKK